MLPVLLAASLAFSPADAHVAYVTASNLVERHTPRDAGTLRGMAAANFILDSASAQGADVRLDRFTAMTPKGERTFTNLVSEFRCGDSNAPWIVLMSHYDTKPGVACPGANDGASTTGLLVALAGLLRGNRPSNANVMLLWTDGEECMEAYDEDDGFWGARHAAKSLRERGVKVKAAICLDMLGDRDLSVSVPRNSTPSLSRAVLKAAKAARLSRRVSQSSTLVKDDHVAFLDAGFPAVDLIDFDYGRAKGLNDWWHTEHDTIDKISEQSLLTAGRLVVRLLDIVVRQ